MFIKNGFKFPGRKIAVQWGSKGGNDLYRNPGISFYTNHKNISSEVLVYSEVEIYRTYTIYLFPEYQEHFY